MKIGNTLLLFLLPLWILLTLSMIGWGQRRRSRRLRRIVAQRLSPLLLSNYSEGKQNLKNLLFLCAIALIGFALAAPKWGYREEERYVKGIDLLVAVDVSKSMLAEDIKPNRLERTKLAILDLIKSFAGHRTGLIAFSGNSFLQCPLTLDHNAFIQSLNALDTDTIPLPGTAINAAIELAEKVYDQTPNQKLLFLFSDGEELANSAIEGAQRAKRKDIRIYTVGIGSAEGTTIPMAEGKSKKVKPLCDRNGQIVKTALDEKTLKEIAEITNGQYYHLSPAALSHLQRDIHANFPILKETSKENKYTEKVYQERYQLFLLLGFLLLILEMLLQTYKKPEKYSISIYYKLSLLIFFCLLPLNGLLAKESGGEIFYKNGDFEKALAFYNERLLKKPNVPELLYNKGTTCLALKQYEEAVDCLKKSIANAPIELQKKAFYNLGNALFEGGKILPDPKKVLEKWKESLRHFQSAIDLDRQFEEAKKNAKYVEEEIKKLEEQQKKQDQDQKDQDQKDQDQKDQDQKDQDQKDQDQKDQDQKDQDQKDQNQKDQDQKDQDQKDQDQKDQDQKDQDQKDQDQKDQDQKDQDQKDQDQKDQDQKDQDQKDQDQKDQDQKDQDQKDQDQKDQDQKDQDQKDSNGFDPQENMPENHKMTKKEAFELLDSLENDEKTLPL
ncbi:MAG: VWA domain-containing protein, partial [Puniceicoccales bacterium]|nr:VWA domain-containing protein [Puniceicoccales bacterium]